MSKSVWPYDTFQEPQPLQETTGVNPIACFVMMPSEPRKKWDDFYSLITDVTKQIGASLGVNIQCCRAIDIVSSGIIHPEIWKKIRTADFIICDVSGHNGNVILELGIAAVHRRKEQIIILRDESDEKPRLFDILPARHLEYEISYSGIETFKNKLVSIIVDVLATIPFKETEKLKINLPFSAKLKDGRDYRELYTEDMTHRLMLTDCLEFGSPLNYRYSWMSLGDLKLTDVCVKADLKMTYNPQLPKLTPFMGVMVSGQSYFSNLGHLIYIKQSGTVHLSMGTKDEHSQPQDEQIGQINNFDMMKFTSFDITINNTYITAKINGLNVEKKLKEIPHVFSSGKIIFIAGYCRVGIRNIVVGKL